jgi:probable O-glycosylation ligase (exosortase A-associated)
MIRTLLIVGTIFLLCAAALAFPHVGVLAWVWVSLGAPHKEVYSAASGWNFNLIIVIVTVIGWMFSREPKYLPRDALSILVFCFLCSLTLASYESLTPTKSWTWWNMFVRSIVLYFPVLILINNRARVQALVWVIVITFGQYSVKGGGFTIATGGAYEVSGPSGMLGDRNGAALAFVCTIPLIWYLFTQSTQRWVRYGLLFSLAMTVIAVLGTYSRGGLIALVAVGAMLVWRTRYRFRAMIAAAVFAIPAVFFMPQQWTDRINSIGEAREDGSFMGRVDAWTFAWRVALDRPLVGGGILATEDPRVFRAYAGDTQTAIKPGSRAAHSIYFQVMGDTGLLGLGIYLAMLAITWLNLSRAVKLARRREELRWIEELSRNMQCSFAAFCVGGAALSLAYFGLVFVIMALSVRLRQLAAAQDRTDAPRAPSTQRRFSGRELGDGGLRPAPGNAFVGSRRT